MSPPSTEADAPPQWVLSDVTVTRGRRAVVSRVSGTLTGGEVVGVLGPNGAGKTTLLKAMAGLLPYDGSMHLRSRGALERKEAAAMSPHERALQVAYVPQISSLRAPLRVRAVVEQGLYARQRGMLWPSQAKLKERRDVVDRALIATDTNRLVECPFTRLSGGEQRRVLLARALATEASVLLLDEPTAALDLAHALAFLDRLRDLARAGYLVVVVMHDLHHARRACDKVLLLRQGYQVAWDSTQKVLASDPIRAVYGVDIEEAAAPDFHLPAKHS